jgi:hypothetical protein
MGASEIVGLAVAVITGVASLAGIMRWMLNGLKDDIKRLDTLVSNHVMHKLEDLNDELSEQGERVAKVEAAVLFWAVSSIALFVGEIDGDQWVQATMWIVGLYSGSNAATKFAGNRNVALRQEKQGETGGGTPSP